MVIYHDRQPFYTSRAYDTVCRTWGTLLGLPMGPVFLIDCMEPVPRFDWGQLTDPNYYEIGLYILELHKG